MEQSQALFCSGWVRHEFVVVHGSSNVTLKVPVGMGGSVVGVLSKGIASSGVCAGIIDVTVVAAGLGTISKEYRRISITTYGVSTGEAATV